MATIHFLLSFGVTTIFYSNVLSLQRISDKCFLCLCEPLSGCQFEMDCLMSGPDPDVCGPYQLTRDYWTEAGLPINGSELGDFTTCSRSMSCSEKVIQRYLSQFVNDCDQDGIIDCSDIAASHYYGQECGSSRLRKNIQWRIFKGCVNQVKPPDNEPALIRSILVPTTNTKKPHLTLPPTEPRFSTPPTQPRLPPSQPTLPSLPPPPGQIQPTQPINNQQTKPTTTANPRPIAIYVHPNCIDNPQFANCKLIVKAKYCSNKYYGGFCCKSCTLAGQLPSIGPHLFDQS